MRKIVITGLASAALILAGTTSASAEMDNRRLGAAIAGLAGLAVLGAIIYDRQKDKREARAPAVKPHDYRPAPYAHRPQARSNDRCVTRRIVDGRWVDQRSWPCRPAYRPAPQRPPAYRHPPRTQKPQGYRPKAHNHRRNKARPDVPVTRQCLRKRWTQRGWVTYTGRECLRKHR